MQQKIEALRALGREVMEKFTATITPSTIRQSVQNDPNKCQIATPVEKTFPEARHVHVTLKKSKKGLRGFIRFTLKNVRYTWETPETLIPLIRNWDKFGLEPECLPDGMPFTIDKLRDVKIGGVGSFSASHSPKTDLAKIHMDYRKRVESGAKLAAREYGPRRRVDGICMRNAATT